MDPDCDPVWADMEDGEALTTLSEMVAAATRRAIAAEAEALRLRHSIMTALGYGADEDAWPPGTHYADALPAFVERLREDLAHCRSLPAEADLALLRESMQQAAETDEGFIGLALYEEKRERIRAQWAERTARECVAALTRDLAGLRTDVARMDRAEAGEERRRTAMEPY